MADLPIDRTIDEPTFTNCGVDMFGPFLIKEGRKELKRYGAIVKPPLHTFTKGWIDFLKFGNKGGDKIFFPEREGLD